MVDSVFWTAKILGIPQRDQPSQTPGSDSEDRVKFSLRKELLRNIETYFFFCNVGSKYA